ncbi:peptidylprolyl isomerase [Pseudoroseomonas sp. WGS1072]|uniref:peptidylprolyl isomerase n=1 Tax=Roseomonas sp. WGS1072 TaxID=3366816 RepID=UPI003BF06D60
MRLTRLTRPLLLLPFLLSPALAQAPASPPPGAPTPQPPSPQSTAPGSTLPAEGNPVVARVDGEELHLADVQAAIAELPEQLRGAPGPMLFPLVVDQLIAQKALVAAARAQKLDQEPAVQRAIRRAEEEQLQQALLRREIAPALTPEALRERYQKEIASKPGEEEVHARHILVSSEEEARKLLAELRKPNADFAAVAKKFSSDRSGQEGGDLGFFKKSDMVPEFANAAFALKKGETSREPVRSAFGWHIIKLEDRRTAAVPSFEESAETLRQAAFEEAVNEAVERVQAAATIERFNMDGSPRAPQPAPSLLDGAAPPPRK